MRIFGVRNPEVAYPSDHRRLPDGVADGLPEPNPTAEYIGDAPWCMETQVGAAVLRGEIDAEIAMEALNQYEAWLDAGEPKMYT